MVKGFDRFIEQFREYPDCYTIIGGAACDILMSEANMSFRATRDIDMILIFEEKAPEFTKAFWDFIKEGGYKCGWKNNPDIHFYRFTEPKPGYPVQIELFSRLPEYHIEQAEGIIPIHIDDDVSSLSAIVLNDEYYNFMIQGRRVVDDAAVLSAEYIIPFKMFARLDLNRRKADGGHVNGKDLIKHKNDVFRLLPIVRTDSKIPTEGKVRDNTARFIQETNTQEIRTEQLGLPFDKETALQLLENIYL